MENTTEIPVLVDQTQIHTEKQRDSTSSLNAANNQNYTVIEVFSKNNKKLKSVTKTSGKRKKKEDISVPPDGILPNSAAFNKVKRWMSIHHLNAETTPLKGVTFQKQKSVEVGQLVDEDKKKKSEAYKARLKDMLANRQNSNAEAVKSLTLE